MTGEEVLIAAVQNASLLGDASFEVLAPTFSFHVMGLRGKDRGKAYLVPDHVHGPDYWWWVVTFIQPEFYEGQTSLPDLPIPYWVHNYISIYEIGNGASIVERSRETLRLVEQRVAAMNERRYLSMFEDKEAYEGPLSCQGVRLVANPAFLKTIHTALYPGGLHG